MQFRSILLSLAVALGVSACDHPFQTVPDTLTPNGPSSQSTGTNQYSLFYTAYQTAYGKALKAAQEGRFAEDGGAEDAYRRMAIEGFGVVQANCKDFFKHRGEDQRWIAFTRDTVTAAGTLATGALAIAGSSTVALSIVALTTATIFNGLNTYQKDFLFGADNISSVETMVMNALTTHAASVMRDTDTWTFQNTAEAILDDQNICKPAKMLALAQEALSNAKPDASKVDETSGNDASLTQQIGALVGVSGRTSLSGDLLAALCWAADNTTKSAADDATIKGKLTNPPISNGPVQNTNWSKANVNTLCNALSSATKATVANHIAAWKHASGEGPAPLVPIRSTLFSASKRYVIHMK